MTDEHTDSEEVEEVEGQATPAESPASRLKAMDPARRITLIVLAVVAVLFACVHGPG